MASPQTLGEPDRRRLALWAARCAERVLPLYDADAPPDPRIPDALARARAFGHGESTASAEIARRMDAMKAAGTATTPAAVAAARAVAHAAAVAHMGAHALGAAAYAVKAVALAHPGDPQAPADEIAWQVARLTEGDRAALRLLPPLGSDTHGPLGPGLLTRGVLADAVRAIQREVGA